MSEETKEMDELEEADKSTAKINKIEVGDDEQGEPDHDKAVAKASDNKTKGKAESAKVKAESKKVKEDDEEEPESDEDEGEEEEEQTKKEAREVPKLKSEILAGLVDHLKGLKKEDLSKIYGSQVIGEEEGDDEEEEDDEEEKEESKKVKESIDQKIDELDVSGDVEALVQGEELSEEFKTKAATIFETAIKSKVRSELEKIQEENDKQMEELAETSMKSMVEKVDDYLGYVVEQWMSENELAIERGLKGEIAEDFISGLKGLFEDHYIDVPDEKYDILEANLTKIEELEDKLNKQMEENVQLRKAKGELVKESMIADIADGMTDTETEKFQSLVDDVEFSDEDSYKEKLQTIKESYFGDKEVKSQDETLTEETKSEEDAPKDIKPVIRFKSKIDGSTVLKDLVQGDVQIDNNTIEDFVILRNDGSPTYNLSASVDDHQMKVTHIIRGDDHKINT